MVSIFLLFAALMRAVIWVGAGLWVGFQIRNKRSLAPLWAVSVGLILLGLHDVTRSLLYAGLGQFSSGSSSYMILRWVLDIAQVVPALGIGAGLLGALAWGLADRAEAA